MATLTVQLPPHLEERLRTAAAAANRSPDQEALCWLDHEARRRERLEERLARLDTLHARIDLPKIDADFVREAIGEGRA